MTRRWAIPLAVLLLAGVSAARGIGPGSGGAQSVGPANRETAYRHNNIGVARLEQYDYQAAAAEFERALDIYPDLAIAHLNLAIARLYEGQLDAAARHGQAALAKLPDLLQPKFVLGLIARADNRPEDAAGFLEQVVNADPFDPGSRVHLGQVRLAQRRFDDAAALFEEALKLEPFNATAAYGVATALTRGGARDKGAAAMERFQRLRDNPAAATFEGAYLAQGRYGEALASTGAEPELVDRAVPGASFVDATDELLPADSRQGRDVVLTDVDKDGHLDLLIAQPEGVRVLRGSGRRFTSGVLLRARDARGVIAGDYDNDGLRDLAVLTGQSLVLFKQESNGGFRDVTAAAIPTAAAARTAAFVDADHDGDLDLVAGARLLRNNGNGRFEDTTSAAGLSGSRDPLAIVATDFDNRRDVDLLFLTGGAAPALFSNQRDGTFTNVATAVGLPADGAYTTIAAGDINKDMSTDFFLGREDGDGVFAMSAPGARFTSVPAPPGSGSAVAARLIDYDNDGLLDLLVLTSRGVKLWRSLGSEWSDVTMQAIPKLAGERATAVAAGDIDGDGDTDLVTVTSAGVRAWRNNGSKTRRSVRVQLSARVSNRDGIGSKIELRAGSLRQRIETFSSSPAVAAADVVFGLGPRDAVDVVRVLWPAGILQAETDVATPVANIEELDRKPSSCPFLYTWNGTRFEFLTDFLGGGEMGYWVAPGVRNVPDADEYVRIPGDRLKARDGRYELRVTNELEEALFLDRLQLLAVAHPDGIDVHPNEGLRSAERREPFTLYPVRNPQPPLRAIDQDGRDVGDRVAHRDQQYVDGFRLAAIQGYADEHWVAFDTGAASSDRRVLLLLTGWTDYAFSSDNVAAHQAGLAFRPPELQAKRADGGWHTVMPEVGLPVGRPQTVVVDVTPYTRSGAREFRIVSTLRVYWDQILVERSAPGGDIQIARLDAASAVLRSRGFSAEVRPEGIGPTSYDYDRVEVDRRWKLMPGRYTREGDVQPLLAAIDDRFVIAAPGDEVALSFDAASLPPLPAGWTRTFLLYADGFSKEMNLHSSSPDALEPLPFHGMSAYPYPPEERYPDTPAHRRYREQYNTRVIGRALPPLETSR